MIQGFDDNASMCVAIHQITVTSRAGSDVHVKADVLQARQCQWIVRIQRQIRPQSKTVGSDINPLLQILGDRVPDEIAVEDRPRLQIREKACLLVPGNQILADALRNPVAREREVIQTHPVAAAAIGSAACGPVQTECICIDDRHFERAIGRGISQDACDSDLFARLKSMAGRRNQQIRRVGSIRDDISGPRTKSRSCVVRSVAGCRVQTEGIGIDHCDLVHAIRGGIPCDITDADSLARGQTVRR